MFYSSIDWNVEFLLKICKWWFGSLHLNWLMKLVLLLTLSIRFHICSLILPFFRQHPWIGDAFLLYHFCPNSIEKFKTLFWLQFLLVTYFDEPTPNLNLSVCVLLSPNLNTVFPKLVSQMRVLTLYTFLPTLTQLMSQTRVRADQHWSRWPGDGGDAAAGAEPRTPRGCGARRLPAGAAATAVASLAASEGKLP